jgi:hypothetical protein
MHDSRKPVDVIYLAACARDARLTRICIASIRHFYPDVPIKLLAGDIIQPGLAEEVAKYWNVGLASLPVGDYGWGMVKLEPLFGAPKQSFMVCDVDTVFTGPVLDVRAKSDAPFFVDDEQLSDADSRRLYYDWDKLRAIDPKVVSAIPAFNVGQWFGTAGLVKRDEFDRWIEWTLPRRLRYQQYFMGGDQGVTNYVLLQKEAYEGLRIERHKLMRWPGYPNSLDGLDVASVAAKTAPPLVIHWAGVKCLFLRNMVGYELLQYFENLYFSRLPFGRVRRTVAAWRFVENRIRFEISRRIKLRRRIWFGQPKPAGPPVLVKPAIGS